MPFQPDYEVPKNRRAYTIYAEEGAIGGNGRVGCLMLHGFMGSPASSRDMARFLAQKGITTHCPLLPGHGNLPHKLHNISRHLWIAEVEEALQTIRQFADQIFVMGHSMGAVLGAYLLHKNNDLRGLIMLAPLFEVPDPRIKLAWLGRIFMPWFYPLKHKDADNDIFLARVTDFDPTIDIHDPSLAEWLMQATRIPTTGVAQMVRMGAIGRRLWSKLKKPALILQGEADPASNPDNAKKIYSRLTVTDKQLKMLPQTGHELMRPFEPAHANVWQLINQFIQSHIVIK